MKEQFCSYETSLKLAEIGYNNPFTLFDYKVFYRNGSNLAMGNDDAIEYWKRIGDAVVIAPLYQEAIDWLLQRLNFYYPFISIQIYNDYSGAWIETDNAVEILFNGLEEAILEGINLWKKNL